MEPEFRYRVEWKEPAIEDLKRIEYNLWTLTAWERSVNKWIGKIIERGNSLDFMPKGMHWRDNYWMTIVGSYKIIYEVLDDAREVHILRIIYSRADLRRMKLK